MKLLIRFKSNTGLRFSKIIAEKKSLFCRSVYRFEKNTFLWY